MKILTTKQIKDLDSYTIKNEPVTSVDLMERACRAFVNWFTVRVDATKKIGIVCGTGNNGGDGLGIARILKEWGYPVKVWIVRGSVPESEDFKATLSRLIGRTEIYEITTEADQGLFTNCDVLIDAIFGTGLSKPPEGIYAQAIRCFNKAEALRISVDIPSGLMADRFSSGEIVKADYTVSFQLPKLAFFLPHSSPFTGEWVLVDIGLKKDFIQAANTSYRYVVQKDAWNILKPRARFSHKGTFGHALIIAGSHGKIGAAVLASRATLRTGTGLVTVHSPKCGYAILQTAVPEAMVSVDTNEYYFTEVHDLDKYAAIGIGPGLGQDVQTIKAIANVLEKFRKPIVIDADGLNLLAANRDLLKLIPEGSILTPHPKEFERLVGAWADDFERLEKQKQLAKSLKAIVILKGAYSSIATPEGCVYFNSSGNPGMATGGTGDVLTGVLTGLLAQSYESDEAAILGVYLHGIAGDLVAREKGEYGMSASDLVESLPFAYKTLKRQ